MASEAKPLSDKRGAKPLPDSTGHQCVCCGQNYVVRPDSGSLHYRPDGTIVLNSLYNAMFWCSLCVQLAKSLMKHKIAAFHKKCALCQTYTVCYSMKASGWWRFSQNGCLTCAARVLYAQKGHKKYEKNRGVRRTIDLNGSKFYQTQSSKFKNLNKTNLKVQEDNHVQIG